METTNSVISGQSEGQLFIGTIKDTALIQIGKDKLFSELSVRLESKDDLVCYLPVIVEKLVKIELAKQMENKVNRIIIIKDEDYEISKKRVLDLVMKNTEGIDTSEIVEELNLDPEIVLKILMELKEEDKIGKANERNKR